MRMIEKWVGQVVEVSLDGENVDSWKLCGFDEFGILLEDHRAIPPYERFFPWHSVEFIGPVSPSTEKSE